jgi:predicted Zn-dependent protease with MMP-like domain
MPESADPLCRLKAAFTMPDEPILPPSLDDLESLAREAFEGIPPTLARFVKDVEIRVDDFPDEETEKEMELESPFDLLGLYRGVALPNKSVGATASDLDRVFLYRRPILDYWCETGEDLYDIMRHVLIHEIGHHFGFSDADMERLENEAE